MTGYTGAFCNLVNKFSIVVPYRYSVTSDYAIVLQKSSLLRSYILGARRGIPEVPVEQTILNLPIGLVRTAAAQLLSTYRGECVRFATYPWFDRWALRKINASDHVISSYAMANECFRKARASGGKTFLEAGNSHPQQFWEIMTEEHARWGCSLPPVYPPYHERALRMMEDVDFVLSPSRYVSDSFLRRGFTAEQIIYNPFACNLDCFLPAAKARPKDRPLTLIHTGMLGLRKGTLYLLEAFRQVRKTHPSARLILISQIHDSMKSILSRYHDLPIQWSGSLPPRQLAELLQRADLFVMPTLEEGLARAMSEALACGLPVITTAHSGINDFIVPDKNGEIVPLRDANAVAAAVLKWGDKIMASKQPPASLINSQQFSFDAFERRFLDGILKLAL
jgi:glycosyltransferase involved in cell wall biosynthesis